ncbi:peptidase U32 family protein [Paenibacillus lentus]|uniref:U32 family peptidase n=1 Tax=Paenibacillus lentus TaxID=1338368 RepID=A0A3Q8S8I0_9BACL|nr:U32 family peptidase [Paenibacillus lentus]AZK44921.1 U32 family peptidase [Paenibacillus lentus]
MARYFNGKEVELLAPTGTFEIFKEVIHANCDAVYFGGPSLNMRMMRKGYNFSRPEIIEAIKHAHALHKKAYVTVNNLLNEGEIEEARDYLRFLEQAGPDAIIVQDFAILALIQEMKLQLPVHSSVMMNVHNREMITALSEMGVTRVVTSREMDLTTTRYLRETTGMELEYFIHGDMCSVHGANCYFSSLVFGMSSNRGKCLKPCRWDYRVKKDGYVYPSEYPLAVKDMFMYEHIPELIHGGVTSFKIEGRMRDTEFVLMLVNAYGDAIDRYIEDPVGFERNRDTKLLYDNRKRDFSTGYAFGRPGLSYINKRYEGTGKFYSTGKVFSTPTEERRLGEKRLGEVANVLVRAAERGGAEQCGQQGTNRNCRNGQNRMELSVHVNNAAQARAALEGGADHVYLSGDVFEPDRPFTKQEIAQLAEIKGEAKLYLGLPRMMTELHFEMYDALLSGERLPIDGILVTNLGAIHKFASKGYPLVGDINLNIFNHLSAEMYAKLGVERFTASVELPLYEFSKLLENADVPLEAVVHGSPALMYMEHDLYENTEVFEPIAEENNLYVDNRILVLMTDKGENPVYRDVHGRCHLMLAKELCLLPVIKELQDAGLSVCRIEGATYQPEQLKSIVSVYKTAIEQPEAAGELFTGMTPVYAGYTLGALQFDGGVAGRPVAAEAEACEVEPGQGQMQITGQ